MTDKLNILLITSEDNGPHFGCYGDHTQPTPCIDKLAGEGVRFNNAYVTQAVCSPGRASILTGLYPHQNGQIGLASHKFTMFGELPSIPTLLKQNQYRTGIMGKLHVLPASSFDFDFVWNPPDKISFSHRDARATAQTAGTFFEQSDQPFFLMLNYSDAHLPWLDQSFGLPEKPLAGDDVKVLPGTGIDTARLRAQAASYYNCLSRLDSSVGMLMEALEKSGKADNTLVIYVTDHGPQFSRGKACVNELALRMPLIVRWPGVSEAKAVRDELSSQIDILPTVLDAAGIMLPDNLPGRSLRPLLKGDASKAGSTHVTDWHTHVFGQWNSSHPWPLPGLFYPQRSVRDERYKLIVTMLSDISSPVEEYYTQQVLVQSGASQEEIDGASPAVQKAYADWRNPPAVALYDLKNDPHEFDNLADDPAYATTRDGLLEVLHQWQKKTGDALADPKKLARFVAEHNHASSLQGGHKLPEFQWEYPDYLAPDA